MTTAADLVVETMDYLNAGQEGEMNQLSGPIGTTDTAFNVSYPMGSMLQLGCVISIDLEDIRVWAATGSTVTACERAINGTSPATHAQGADIYVRPKFNAFRVLRAVNEELKSLSAASNGMFQVLTVDVTYNAAVQGYDLAGVQPNIIRVLEARYRVPGPSRNWPQIRRYSLQRNMDTTVWPSGLVFDTYQRAWPGLAVHIRYAAPYGQLVNLTDDVTAVAGLQPTALDIPPMGAAIRLVYGREIKRNFTEAGVEPRRFEEVPPGAVLRSPAGLAMLRTQRIREESAVLWNQYPPLSEAV
jgi:hypothetical protein